MLQINHLSIYHRDDQQTLIDDFSLTVNAGDKVAIIGEEGNGKSTLLKFILQDPDLSNYLDIQGELVNQFSQLGYLPQQLSEENEQRSIYDFFNQTLNSNQIDYNQLYLLGGQLNLDIDRIYSGQKMASLSGGERIKFQLLKILLSEPDLLLLDEPSNDLDFQTLEWLEKFIRNYDQTIIFISHDVTLLQNTATSILHIERLQHKSIPKITYSKSNYSDYLDQRHQSFQHQMQVALKQRDEDEKRMEKHRQIEQKLHHQLNVTKDATAGNQLKKSMANVKARGKRYEKERQQYQAIPIQEDPINIRFSGVKPLPAQKTIIQIDNDCLGIGNRILAQPINFTMKGQDKIGIIGPNGIGKSTLLKHIWHRIEPVEDLSPGYMPQTYQDALDHQITPIEYLSQTGSPEERTQIMTYLGSMRYLPEEMMRPIAYLSGGQKAKLLLMKLDFHQNNLLLLDEPTRNFSPSSQPEIIDVFINYPGAILTVSHDRIFLDKVCRQIYQLSPKGLSLIR